MPSVSIPYHPHSKHQPLVGKVWIVEKKYTVFIVEDHQLFREGLKSMLKSRDDIEIVGEAEDGLEAVRLIPKARPDLVLLDLSMPKMGGISVIKEIKRELSDTRILALTIHESDQYVLAIFQVPSGGRSNYHTDILKKSFPRIPVLRANHIFMLKMGRKSPFP